MMLGKINPLDGKIKRGDFIFPSYFEQEVKADGLTPIDDDVEEWAGQEA